MLTLYNINCIIILEREEKYNMKLRKYRGFYDNGRDQLEIDYYSEHRNYSKYNMEDMKNAYLRKFGFYRGIKFEFGYLIESEF